MAWKVVLGAMLALAACGRSRSGPPDASSSFADSGPSPDAEAGVPMGTCGVSRRIPLPARQTPIWGGLSRVRDGFTVGPWQQTGDATTPVHWLRFRDGTAAWQELSVPGGAGRGVAQVLAIDPDRSVYVYAGGAGASASDTRYETLTFAAGTTGPGVVQPLLDAFFRGTIRSAARAALDGQQALFMVGHVAVQGPRLALIAADGGRVGDVTSIDADLWDCDGVVPTDHAGAFAMVDQSPDGGTGERFRLLELGAGGEVTLRVEFPVARGAFVLDGGGTPCPLVVGAPDGFVVLTFVTGGRDAPTFRVSRIHHGGDTTHETWAASGWPIGLAATDDAIVAVAKTGDRTFALRHRNAQPGGGDETFDLSLGAGVASGGIPSEPGRLFVFVTDPNTDPQAQQIVEISCP